VHVTDRATFCVARTIRLPLPVATQSASRLRRGNDPVRAIGLPAGGRLELELRFRRDAWHPVGRPDLAPARAGGALYGRSNRRVCRIELELSPWAGDVTEVAVRPAVGSPYRWSGRRVARWFEHAHAAVDTLRSELLRHSVVDAVAPDAAAAAVAV
jgi:hypothetical protein